MGLTNACRREHHLPLLFEAHHKGPFILNFNELPIARGNWCLEYNALVDSYNAVKVWCTEMSEL
jgi:hypothetical protein